MFMGNHAHLNLQQHEAIHLQRKTAASAPLPRVKPSGTKFPGKCFPLGLVPANGQLSLRETVFISLGVKKLSSSSLPSIDCWVAAGKMKLLLMFSSDPNRVKDSWVEHMARNGLCLWWENEWMSLTDQPCWEHSDIFLQIWQKLLYLLWPTLVSLLFCFPVWISHVPAKGPAKYIFIPVKRWVTTSEFFLIMCQNCAAFSAVTSIVFLQLHVGSSCSSSRQSNCFASVVLGEKGVGGAHCCLHPSFLWSHPTNPTTLLILSTAEFVEGVIIFSFGFLLHGGYCCSRIVDDLISQKSSSYKFWS